MTDLTVNAGSAQPPPPPQPGELDLGTIHPLHPTEVGAPATSANGGGHGMSAEEFAGPLTPAPRIPAGMSPEAFAGMGAGAQGTPPGPSDEPSRIANATLTLGLSDKFNAAHDAAWKNPAVQSWANGLASAVGVDQPFKIDPNAPGFVDAYHQSLAAERERRTEYEADNPVVSGIATAAGVLPGLVAGAAMAPEALAGGAIEAAPTIGSLIKSGARLGAVAGGVGGFGSTDDTSATGDLAAAGEGAVTGGIFGGLLGAGAHFASPYIEKVMGPISDWFSSRFGMAANQSGFSSPEQQALKAITQRMGSSSAGAPTAQDMLDLMAAGEGAPLGLIDVGGENVQGLAGTYSRTPGESKQIIRGFLKSRDAGAATRLNAAVNSDIGSGSAYNTIKALDTARYEAAKPLYARAFAGGSTAPLESQFRDALIEATGRKGQVAAAIAKIEREKPGALAARGAAGKDVRDQYLALHKQLRDAEADRLATVRAYENAKAASVFKIPGAVWSPRIAQLLKNPDVQKGIPLGMKTIRNEADAAGEVFDPTEYAVTGADAEGKPVVSKVPNMRLLDAAKKGLDQIVADSRSELTGRLSQYGRSVDMLRRALLKELDRLNPSYAVARAAYSGPSASIDAVRAGQHVFDKVPEENSDEVSKLSASDREFYKLGAADTARKKIAQTTPGGNEALAVSRNDWMRSQLRPLFDTEAGYRRFMGSVEAEHTMFQTKQAVIGNSETAGRLAEDAGHGEVLGHLADAAIGAAQGAAGTVALSSLKALAATTRYSQDPKIAAAGARLLTETDPAKVRGILAQIVQLSKRKSNLPALAAVGGGQAGRAAPPLIGTR